MKEQNSSQRKIKEKVKERVNERLTKKDELFNLMFLMFLSLPSFQCPKQ